MPETWGEWQVAAEDVREAFSRHGIGVSVGLSTRGDDIGLGICVYDPRVRVWNDPRRAPDSVENLSGLI